MITSFQKQMSDTGSLDKHFLLLHMIVLLNHPLSLSQIQEVWTWLDIITTQNHHQFWYNLQAYSSVLVEIMNNIASEKAKNFKSQVSCPFIFSPLKLLLNNSSNLLLYCSILPLFFHSATLIISPATLPIYHSATNHLLILWQQNTDKLDSIDLNLRLISYV